MQARRLAVYCPIDANPSDTPRRSTLLVDTICRGARCIERPTCGSILALDVRVIRVARLLRVWLRILCRAARMIRQQSQSRKISRRSISR